MTLFQKQTYLGHYSYITSFMVSIMEKASNKKNTKKYNEAKSLVDCINQMYMYTQLLENQNKLYESKLKIERKDKLRAVESLRKIRGDE